jgi:hypothetical protein
MGSITCHTGNITVDRVRFHCVSDSIAGGVCLIETREGSFPAVLLVEYKTPVLDLTAIRQ